MLLELLSKKHNADGLTTAQIGNVFSFRYDTLTKLLGELVEEKKIRKLKFGNAYLYKLNKEEDKYEG